MLDSTTELWTQIAIAVGTVGGFIFLGFQSIFTKEQVKIINEQFLVTKRPWIYRDPEPRDDPNASTNYKIFIDRKINEYCIRVPLINSGQFHSSSVKYFHRFITPDGFKDLYKKCQITDEDLNKLTVEELIALKKEIKSSYVVIGPRVIVPGTAFAKKFYLTKNKIEHYRNENPDDTKIIQEYESGKKIYLLILVEYTFYTTKQKSEYGEYGGILKLEKSEAPFRNDDWLREWVN